MLWCGMKLLLNNEKVDPDARGHSNQPTPLMEAAMNGQTAIVELLLNTSEVKPDLGFKPEGTRSTALSLAVENGHEAIVRLLLKQDDIDTNAVNKCGRAPLSLAAESGREAIVRLLLEQDDVDANTRDINGFHFVSKNNMIFMLNKRRIF